MHIKELETRFQEWQQKVRCPPHPEAIAKYRQLQNKTNSEQSRQLLHDAFYISSFGQRYGKKLLADDAGCLILALFPDLLNIPSKGKFSNAIQIYFELLQDINLQFYETFDKDMATMLDNIKNRLRYERLDSHGPHLGPIDERYVELTSFKKFTLMIHSMISYA